MTVIAATETFDQRKGVFDESFKRDATRTFRVTSNSKNDDPYLIIYGAVTGGFVPTMWAYHPSDFLSRVRSITADQEHGSTIWKVVCQYSTHGKDPAKEDENPLNKPVIRTFGTKSMKRFTWLDRDDVPILNTARTMFAPLEVDFAAVSLKFQRNEAFFDGTVCLNYVEHINSGTFGGADPGTVKCDAISATEKYEGDYHFWEVNYDFSYNKYGWQPRILQQGKQQRVSFGGTHYLIPCTDKSGNPVTEPVPLNDDGIQIPHQNLPGAAVFRTYNVLFEADFNALGLPA